MTIENTIKAIKALNSIHVYMFEDYLISRKGELHHLDPETGIYTDISHIIFNYTKKGVPIYRILDLKDKSKFLEIRLDKLVLSTFIGDIEAKIIHKDGDYKNCTLDNLKYNIELHEMDNRSLFIPNKEFKPLINYENYYISNDGIIYNKESKILTRRCINKNGYICSSINKKKVSIHRFVYIAWNGDIPKGYTINHEDGNKLNNQYKNLSSMTSAENYRHSHNIGLRNVRWSEADIHIICQLLEQNKSPKYIAKEMNLTTKIYKKALNSSLSKIRYRLCWVDISSQYNIDNYNIEDHILSKKLNRAQIVEICDMVVGGISNVEIAKLYDISTGYLEHLKRNKSWKYLTELYDFSNFINYKYSHLRK